MNINEIASTIANAGTKFASFTYRSKSDDSLARYTVILGFSYNTLLEKSKTELEIVMNEIGEELKPAAQAVMDSINKSIAAHANGSQSDDYTKKGQYVSVGNGVNINTVDNTIQVFGLVRSKVVLESGVRKQVKSAPFTIAKNKVRQMLSMSKFREFAFDVGNIHTVKVNGDTLEVVDAYDFEPSTEESVTV